MMMVIVNIESQLRMRFVINKLDSTHLAQPAGFKD